VTRRELLAYAAAAAGSGAGKYAVGRYLNDVIRHTAELIRFKTFATGVPNRNNPEFIRQRDYLRSLSGRLGLRFADVDGYVQEIWIGDGAESFGIMSHSDVQPVDPREWSHDPWSGEVKDGCIWGRGAIDDKGPIAAVMFGMRALLDRGVTLRRKTLLLVGTDEESANEDVAYYLKARKPPSRTIVVDSNYPVVCAEKGWGGLWLELPRQKTAPPGDGWIVEEIGAGIAASIVPEKATAVLRAQGAAPELPRPPAKVTVERKDAQVMVTARGRSVHSSLPQTGENALMTLLVYLDRLRPLPNALSLMAGFAAAHIGFDVYGGGLGIAHRDPFMGPLTVSATVFETTPEAAKLTINLRVPKGITTARIEKEIDTRLQAFQQARHVRFGVRKYLEDPLYQDPNSEFVERLLGVYNRVTGENRNAQSISGGTYAKRLPNALVFGPAMPDEEYLGHRPDEHIRISTLSKNLEILTEAMAEFAG
jgi:dipeptidase D